MRSGAFIPAGLSPTAPENGVRAQFRSASLVSEQAPVLNWDLTPFSSPPSQPSLPLLSSASATSTAFENSAQNTAVAPVERAQGATENVAFSTRPEVGLQGVQGPICAHLAP